MALSQNPKVPRIVIHPNKVNHIIIMPPRRLEKLNLAKALEKVGMPQIVKKAVEKTNANKKKKKHDRASVILGSISAIAVKARKTEQITEFAREMKEHIGIKSFPERSSLSRLWRRLDKPLYKVFQELSLIALRLTGKKVSFGNVVALDVQSILSKSKISGVGFVKERDCERIKDPSQKQSTESQSKPFSRMHRFTTLTMSMNSSRISRNAITLSQIEPFSTSNLW